MPPESPTVPPPGFEPFLAAVVADPGDDLPRLVFADWLEENGDPARAEFIRAQVELARAPGGRGDPALAARADELLAAHGAAWRAELPELFGGTWLGFHRGFVAGADLADGRWAVLQRQPLFRAAPLRQLTLRAVGRDGLRRVTAMPELGILHELVLRGCHLGRDGWEPLTDCPNLRTLRRLEIGVAADDRAGHWGRRYAPTLTPGDVQAFVTSPYFPRLEELCVMGWVYDAGTRLLRQRFPRVRIEAGK